jgi:hypothetical protein
MCYDKIDLHQEKPVLLFGTKIPPKGEKGVIKGKNSIYLFSAVPAGRNALFNDLEVQYIFK